MTNKIFRGTTNTKTKTKIQRTKSRKNIIWKAKHDHISGTRNIPV